MVLTVCLGVTAVFLSFFAVSKLTFDEHGGLALGLFSAQIISISIQLGAIFNNKGRDAIGSTIQNKTEGQYNRLSYL